MLRWLNAKKSKAHAGFLSGTENRERTERERERENLERENRVREREREERSAGYRQCCATLWLSADDARVSDEDDTDDEEDENDDNDENDNNSEVERQG